MGTGILSSVKEVFPGVADYICHYHFLADIGTDLFGTEHTNIRKSIQSHKIKGQLRNTSKKLEKHIEETPELKNCLSAYLKSKKFGKPGTDLIPEVTAYILINIFYKRRFFPGQCVPER